MSIDINLLIISAVKQYPTLYNKAARGYYINSERNKALNAVTDSVNENLEKKLTCKDFIDLL